MATCSCTAAGAFKRVASKRGAMGQYVHRPGWACFVQVDVFADYRPWFLSTEIAILRKNFASRLGREPMTQKTNAVDIKDEILERVADLFEEYPHDVAMALSLASVSAFAKIYPAKLTAGTKKIIKTNYPDATDDLMAERAISAAGAKSSICTSIISAQIAMDYSPLSCVKAQMDTDMALPPSGFEVAHKEVILAFKAVRAIGFSSFGAASMMIGLSAQMAKAEGAGPFELMRPLLETALSVFEDDKSPHRQAERDRAVMDAVCKEMCISQAEYKRLLKAVGNS